VVASIEFAEFLCDELSPIGHVTTRRMFGKTGVFCEGVMLGMVTADVLYLRVDDENRTSFAFPPLNYLKDNRPIDLSFWRTPDRVFTRHEELISWARSALAAAHRVAAKRRRRVT
jgi:DNA transformation protein